MTLAPADRARRGRVRSAAATVIILAWAAALAGLVQREVVRTPAERMSELAARVNPGNVFYAVELGGKRVGWASSTIDTVADSVSKISDTLSLLDEVVADIPSGSATRRTSMRTQVMLSRGFALRRFVVDIDTNDASLRISGGLQGDTSIAYVVERNGTVSDTHHVRVLPPVLLPTMVPLATILRAPPKVGRRATYHTFDPSIATSRDVTMEILAESLFVVSDSATMDAATGRWVSAPPDTVRAWKLRSSDDRTPASWVDAQGRVVETTQLGTLQLSRTAYEVSFENWRLDAKASARAAAGSHDVRPTTAIADSVAPPARRLKSLKVRLIAPSLSGFALRGGRQELDGNVVTVTVEPPEALTAAFKMPVDGPMRARYRNELQAEPYLETRTGAMLRQAIAIIKHEREPRAMVGLLVKWVSDSVRKVATFTMPDAIHVLQVRAGDANDHTQLFTALARSVDIPTRIVSGLAYIGDQFYYHSWAEVYLGNWVAVDPTFGQFPADAAHLRLAAGGLERRDELLRLVATLHIDVLDAR